MRESKNVIMSNTPKYINDSQDQSARPIRILHVYMWGLQRGSGVESVLMNYYRHIDRDKIQFDFLLHWDTDDYDKEVEALGGRVYRLPAWMMYRRFAEWRKALGEKFEEIKPDIIHVHFTNMGRFVVYEANKAGIPVIAHSHGANDTEGFSKRLIRRCYNIFYPWRATAYLACAQLAGEWLFGKKIVRQSNFKVLKNAIDVGSFSYNPETRKRIRDELGLEEQQWVIGHTGRFDIEKNHNFLIEVFAEIRKHDKNAVLVLAGDGPLRDKIEKMTDALGFGENVLKFLGIRSDIADVLQAYDLFIMPSHNEGLGLAAIEAQAAGVPCLLSDIFPPEAIVTDNVKCLPLSAEASRWAETALQLKGYERKDTSDIMRKKGWDIHDNAKQLAEYYYSLVKK